MSIAVSISNLAGHSSRSQDGFFNVHHKGQRYDSTQLNKYGCFFSSLPYTHTPYVQGTRKTVHSRESQLERRCPSDVSCALSLEELTTKKTFCEFST
jgi:hypothetical protein